jgi:hypothetical protein
VDIKTGIKEIAMNKTLEELKAEYNAIKDTALSSEYQCINYILNIENR